LGAEASFRKAQEINPKIVNNNLGCVFQAKGDFDGAEAAVKMSLPKDPHENQRFKRLEIAFKIKNDSA